MRKFLLALLPLLLASCSMLGFGEPPHQLQMVEYGTFRDGVLVAKTDGVPRQMGLSFGYRVKVTDTKGGPVKAKIVTETPGLLDPAKPTPQMEYVSQVTLGAGDEYDVFFTFSHPWEMVTGRWELRVETDKGEVISHTFDVYDPGQ